MELINAPLVNQFRLWLAANGGPNHPNNAALLAAAPAANAFYTGWIPANGNSLPAPPVTPIEFHPYLTPYPIDLNCQKLIIGTFPPITYLCDSLGVNSIINPVGNAITPPTIPFFYGNQISLWKFAADPILSAALVAFNAGVANRPFLLGAVQAFLNRNKTTINDIIYSTQRKAINANDRALYNIDLNLPLLSSLCSRQSKIRTLIFTSSGTSGTSGLQIRTNNLPGILAGTVNIQSRDAFSLFIRACQVSNIRVDIRLWGPAPQPWMTVNLANAAWFAANTANKILFRLKLYCPKDSDNAPEFTVLAGPVHPPLQPSDLPIMQTDSCTVEPWITTERISTNMQ